MKTCNQINFYLLYRNAIERIPCATLLIRLIKAPMEGSKVLGL